MKPVSVLYLIRTWALGGSHTIIRLLLRHLPRDRFKIIVVPYDAPGRGDQDFIDSVRRESGDVAPERIPWRSRAIWFRARGTVAGLIRKYEIDLIHTHDTNSNVLMGLGRTRWPCACVASPYGWWEPEPRRRIRMYHWIEKNFALPRFDRLITVSHTMKRKILEGRTPAERIKVIHTGLDLAQFDGGKSRETVRSELSIAPEEIVVGTVSRLFREKGHKYLIEAAAHVIGDCPRLRLLIVGTGDQRETLEREAENRGIRSRVTFTGYCEDLPGVLRAMDLFAQPSIQDEGFPTAILEAQVMGLPIIASNIGGTFETIDIDRTGVLVPPRDSEALAVALRQLAHDGARRQRMAAAARPWVERTFTLENMVAQVAQTYEEALDHFARTVRPA